MNTRAQDAAAYHAASLERMKTQPVPNGQKFPPGSRVHITEDLGSYMAHFISGKDATVMYTYAHVYGGDSVKSYCLDIDGHGENSWYLEQQLTLIEAKETHDG